MTKSPAKSTTHQAISVLPIGEGSVTVNIVGRTPLIFNRMSEKAKRELLMPGGRKRTDADRAVSLKHEPLEEYRASAYTQPGANVATRLVIPAPAFKGAMKTAALDIPGTKRAEIGRLLTVEGYSIELYGKPLLLMSAVRSSDINHTPDIRTRAIVPYWAATLYITFAMPKLNPTAVLTLLAAGGIVSGIGDWRQEKGSGDFGRYYTRNDDDEEWHEIVRTGGREVQDVALEVPEFFNAESQELFEWFVQQKAARSAVESGPKPKRGVRGKNGSSDAVVVGMA